MPLQQVHLRINDAATGQPTPVRLRVTDAAGVYYPPHGHSAEFPTGDGEAVGGNLLLDRKAWAYIDGICEIALPPGELLIEATKGPEYRPLRETIHLPAGKLALRLTIARWIDMRNDGWYSGDTRAHFLTPHAALREAAAEDLAVVNLLASKRDFASQDGQVYQTFPNLAAFRGQQPCLERDGHLVAVNTLNTHPIMGSLGLLHCHRIVYPLSFGGPDATDDWSLDDWCGQCHRKKGLVVWTNAFDPRIGHAGEALAALILGHVDALELNLNEPGQVRAWYHMLNAGLRVPIVGGSGKISNRTPLGALRTYARRNVGETFAYSAWIEAIRGGRTFVTSGPIPTFHVQGEGEGTIHNREWGATDVLIHFAAYSLEPIEKAELLVNGVVVAVGYGKEVRFQTDMPAGGWLAVRYWQDSRVVAHTSPQYVQVDGVLAPVDPGAVAFLDGHFVRSRQWVESEGRFNNPKSREHLLGIFDAARETLRNASRV